MTHRRKLIEVALPLEAINKASAREKSIRHGHPSTLHLWWARRPLAAARAVIFAQMVDDPSGYVDQLKGDAKLRRKAESILKARHARWKEATATAETAKQAGISAPEPGPEPKLDDILAGEERQRLFRIIEELVLWENTTNETVLQKAREEIWQSWRRTCAENAGHPRAKELFDRHKLPAFHDPFAGGGALPLEAQRLGLEAYASDLNPVAVLINKAMIEIPPKFAGRPPVNPESRNKYLGTRASRPHKDWHSRGYLPHFDHPGLIQSITFRLSDSVPAAQIVKWQEELAWHIGMAADDPAAVELRRRIDRFEDAGAGACHLRAPQIAELVESALLHFDGQRYRLIAWCVMPNHVHALIETLDGHPLGDVVHSWKSFTAKQANKLLGRTGAFWMEDYYDRFVRDENHLAKAKAYIEENPVKAGLAAAAAEWRYSSAGTEDAGGTPALPGVWRGAQGLAEDVRYYGQWMRDEAEKRIGHLYPKIEITPAMAAGSAGVSPARPDLQPLVGRKLTVIAWLWARTVKSPNPAFRDVDVPLASTFLLSTKPGREAWVEVGLGARASCPQEAYHFTVNTTAAGGTPLTDAARMAALPGTKLARGANFRCVMSGTPIAGDYIKAEGKAGRMGARLMAIVAEGERGRVYLPPTPEHEAAAKKAKPEWKPEQPLPNDRRNFWSFEYGLTTLGDLFTPRQLEALTTFSDLVVEGMQRIRADALAAGLGKDDKPLREGGTGATGYAEAVSTYLAFAQSKACNRNTSLCIWEQKMDRLVATFGRQALPMVWDYAETNPIAGAGGDIFGTVVSVVEVIEKQFNHASAGAVCQADAVKQDLANNRVVSTDPPYYDNIGYADLSDFFYPWLRRSLRGLFPELFATMAVPKAEELVATPYRHGGKEKAEAFFLEGMTGAMRRLAEQTHSAFPVTIYYAFKQSESAGNSGTASTGWETFIGAVILAGFGVSGTWPVRTEQPKGLRAFEQNALASSIVLVCRPRAADAPTATRREFVAALQRELPEALRHLQAGNIAPVDLAQAAIGPGMAVFTRHARVLDAQGNALSVREALALINETLDTALAEQEGDFDPDSRWALAWFEQHGFAEGEFGVAETLSKAKNTSISGLADAGILVSAKGKVRLLKPEELPENWDPTTDTRLTHWETVHHLIRALNTGEVAAAGLLAAIRKADATMADAAREFAYRLYSISERKKRAADALGYNALVQAWPELARLAQEAPVEETTRQGELI